MIMLKIFDVQDYPLKDNDKVPEEIFFISTIYPKKPLQICKA